METPCLELRKVSKNFKGLIVVNEVSFTVGNGQIVSIIGPNGAGKTSIFNLITGVYVYRGKILFQGIGIIEKETYEIASLGISRTFQNGGLFKEMTVLENVMLGLHGTVNSGFFSSVLRLPSVKQSEEEITKKSLRALRNINFETKSDTLSANLSYGDQKLVELARAIVSNPRLLLLDEPGAGLNETEKEKLIKHIQGLKNQGMTILLVEHHMDMVMRISDKIIVLNFGNKIAEGCPEEITKNPDVITAYLGTDAPYAGDS
jgi:branched-chain amino acid transport system ATP-binding protein